MIPHLGTGDTTVLLPTILSDANGWGYTAIGPLYSEQQLLKTRRTGFMAQRRGPVAFLAKKKNVEHVFFVFFTKNIPDISLSSREHFSATHLRKDFGWRLRQILQWYWRC